MAAPYTILHPDDNVAVALAPLARGTPLHEHPDASPLLLSDDIPPGHKFALRPLAPGDAIVKYGAPIGRATEAIAPGAWVHVHNVRTGLSGEVDYVYTPTPPPEPKDHPDDYAAAWGDAPGFDGYRRANGTVGIRNELWIVPTVGCVNRLTERLAAHMNVDGRLPDGVGPAVAFPHPHGCSQLGDDHERTRGILANLARHPNAGGVLFVGLGCENNTIASFRALVESFDDRNPHIAYIVAQDEGDEFAAALTRLDALAAAASTARRTRVPVSALTVGLKCGGSDGLSGITANPLFGLFTDGLVDRGGRALLTEVPEMFGAEGPLLNRSADAATFERGVAMVNDFKRYFERHGQTIYENPSPGNKDGGLTTLEDKSLGCTQKAGTRTVADVLPYGGTARCAGVTLVSGPGNDLVASTLLAAAGAQLILFSTGRGTPLGAPVPVVKVSTNSGLARRKPHWMDFDAGPLAEGASRATVLADFVARVLAVASGAPTRNEEQGARDFSIFKDGVTL